MTTDNTQEQRIERCPYELYVIKYFGLQGDVSFNKKPNVIYADLVNILAMFDSEVAAKRVEPLVEILEKIEDFDSDNDAVYDLVEIKEMATNALQDYKK